MDKLKAAEVIADAATPAVETAMEIGRSIAETLDKPVEVVFEVIQKTPFNMKKAALITAGLLAAGAIAGTGWHLWNKRKKGKKVIIGETVETVGEELPTVPEQREQVAETVAASNGSSKHNKR